jgi:hypothetical protein
LIKEELIIYEDKKIKVINQEKLSEFFKAPWLKSRCFNL